MMRKALPVALPDEVLQVTDDFFSKQDFFS